MLYLSPGNDTCLCLCSLHMLDISYKGNHTVCGLLCLLISLSIMFSRFIHVVAPILHFLWLNNSPLCRSTTFYSFIHQLMNIELVSLFGYYG